MIRSILASLTFAVAGANVGQGAIIDVTGDITITGDHHADQFELHAGDYTVRVVEPALVLQIQQSGLGAGFVWPTIEVGGGDVNIDRIEVGMGCGPYLQTGGRVRDLSSFCSDFRVTGVVGGCVGNVQYVAHLVDDRIVLLNVALVIVNVDEVRGTVFGRCQQSIELLGFVAGASPPGLYISRRFRIRVSGLDDWRVAARTRMIVVDSQQWFRHDCHRSVINFELRLGRFGASLAPPEILFHPTAN